MSSFGGGLGVIFKEELGLRSYTTGYNLQTFEHAFFTARAKVCTTLQSTDHHPHQEMALHLQNFSRSLTHL